MAVKTMVKNAGTGQYNAGWHELTISKAVDGEWNGKRVIDEVANLVGTRVNVLFVKEPSKTDGKEYSEVYDVTPVAQETEHLTYTEDDVTRMKAKVENRQSTARNANNNVVGTVTTDTTSTSTADTEIPF